MSLRLELEEAPAHGRFLFRGPGFVAQDHLGRRVVKYDCGGVASYDYRRRQGRISAKDPVRLRELAYLALLSRTGEALDRAGLHRVHALGFESGGRGGLLLLPSGGGKSTLALELLRRSEAGLLSDDTPVVGVDGSLRAFPLRMGFKPGADLEGVPARHRRSLIRRRYEPKVVVDVDYFRGRVPFAARPRWLVVGRSSRGAPALRRCGKAKAAAALSSALVLGWGVAQMSEYMIRPDFSLASIALSRAKAAAALLARCELLELRLGESPAEAADLLAELWAS